MNLIARSAVSFVCLLLPILGSAACTLHQPMTVSTSPIGLGREVPVKVVTGSSTAERVFIFGPSGDDSLEAAIEDARSQAPSDTMMNVFIDREIFCVPLCAFPLFYTRTTTTVFGTLVRYENTPEFESAIGTDADPIVDAVRSGPRESRKILQARYEKKMKSCVQRQVGIGRSDEEADQFCVQRIRGKHKEYDVLFKGE